MKYKIIVIKTEENPKYEEELAIFREERDRMRYGGGRDELEIPAKDLAETALKVQLTEEQWKAVQKAVLETFK